MNDVVGEHIIEEVLLHIKKQIGLTLTLCDYFTGLRGQKGNKFFNVVLKQKTSESQEYEQLVRFSDKFKTIYVEPNGEKRIAIYIDRFYNQNKKNDSIEKSNQRRGGKK